MRSKHIEDIYPLSPMQEGLLFHSLYAPERGLYITQFPYNCKGINTSALRQAWRRIIDRHPIFRTAFAWENTERPMQVVGRKVELPFQIVDWRDLSAAEQEARFDAYLAEDRRRGFQLNKAPLLRIALFRTGDDTYKFLLSHHHILMDGWSTLLVFKEAFAFYEAIRNEREPELEPNRPFKDYIAWLLKQDLATAEAFWRENLKGFTAPTPLAVDRIPGRALSSEESYAEEFVVLPAGAMSALQSLTRRHQLTVNTVAQGAWALLLSRYSGELDVAFGVVVSGRSAPLAGIEAIVGLLINNLMTRVRISPQAPVAGWLKEAQAQQAEARQYEHTPLALAQRWSEIPSGERLFESIISFQNFPVSAALERSGREFESIHTIESSAYPLTLVASVGEELVMSVRYDRRFFDQPTAARLAGHLQSLLESIVADPRQSLSQLSFLTSAERKFLLTEWNHGQAPAVPGLCIHELFEAQAARTPEATAVICGAEQVSYGELNRRANRLAYHLRRLGVGPEARVGLCVERSVEMVVGALGILKAGGAYVPLDAGYPAERLRRMITDARMPVIVTQERFLERITVESARAVYFDRDSEAIARECEENPASGVTPDNLAYVIYTSGSTGRPKGAGVFHRGFVTLLSWFVHEFAISAGDRGLLVSSFSFDLTQKNIFAPLITGGRLHLSARGYYDAAAIRREIHDCEITMLNCTPSAFYPLVNDADQHAHLQLASLRLLFLGGEPISLPNLSSWMSSPHFGAEIINTYGPTECTDVCAFHRLNRATAPSSSSPPIGRPVLNARLAIADRNLSLLPIGVTGELCVMGAGVGVGYINDPSLTAAKFFPDPFSGEPGARLYKTGDMTRYLPDGDIEFLGRVDHQVKVRGFRLELGEVEAMLRKHEAVREVAVVAVCSEEGQAGRLVAYVVGEAGRRPTAGELREHLRKQAPEYMTPQAFVLIDEMPLTPNGKVDRKALPATTDARLEPEDTYVAPRNSVEESIVDIWSQLLGVDPVGVNDNFFAVGGNSLLAIQLTSRLKKAFDLELQLRVIYDHPTPAALGATVVKAQAEQSDVSELARLLAELENMSEGDARTMLEAAPAQV
jgi:amino acid adenylation domain-containing protein